MSNISRRTVIKRLGASASVGSLSWSALAAERAPRHLSFTHLHTGKQLNLTYHDGRKYLPGALSEVNLFLSDFRTKESHPIDPALLDILHDLKTCLDCRNSKFEVISGYRSPATNEQLRQASVGVAKKSLHMQGRAIDVRLSDMDSDRLRQAAISLGRGGVGHYPSSNFVHLDTGRFRYW